MSDIGVCVMVKAATKKPTASAGRADMASKVGEPLSKVGRVKKTGASVPIRATRFEAVMRAAELSGLLGGKSTRIGGRISPALIEKAKEQTGIETDTDLIEFALANVALDDNFGKTFTKTRGTVDPSLKLGF
jgi:hypothetical protein